MYSRSHKTRRKSNLCDSWLSRARYYPAGVVDYSSGVWPGRQRMILSTFSAPEPASPSPTGIIDICPTVPETASPSPIFDQDYSTSPIFEDDAFNSTNVYFCFIFLFYFFCCTRRLTRTPAPRTNFF